MSILNAMLEGGILVCAWAISLFFVRFWKKSGDGLFLFFAIAFLLLGVERVVLGFLPAEFRFAAYLIRLGAFLLIILAVWTKNKKR